MASKDISTFTTRDFELLAGAMKCLKGNIEVDYKVFAERFGFKNGNSAKAAWCNLRKKLDKMAEANSTCTPSLTITSPETPETTPSKGKKRKGYEKDDEIVESSTPTTKKRGRLAPFGISRGKTATPAGQDDAEELPIGHAESMGTIKAEESNDS